MGHGQLGCRRLQLGCVVGSGPAKADKTKGLHCRFGLFDCSGLITATTAIQIGPPKGIEVRDFVSKSDFFEFSSIFL